MWYREKKWRRFIRYSFIGGGTFLFDLALLYGAVSLLDISYVVATPVAFLIAVSFNYALSRKFVFRGTKRRVDTGYARFIIAAFAGAALTTIIVTTLVAEVGIHYLIARVFAACCIGILNYLYNLHVNFKVAGYHHEKEPVL